MIKSIQHFEEVGVKNLGKVLENVVREPEKQAEFIYGVTDRVIQLGLNIIREIFESMDKELRVSRMRKSGWVISRRDETALITSLGTVKYHKTVFKNKETGGCEYLLDRIMGLESHIRMTKMPRYRCLKKAND